MHALSVITILAQEQISEAKDLYPKLAELILGRHRVRHPLPLHVASGCSRE